MKESTEAPTTPNGTTGQPGVGCECGLGGPPGYDGPPIKDFVVIYPEAPQDLLDELRAAGRHEEADRIEARSKEPYYFILPDKGVMDDPCAEV